MVRGHHPDHHHHTHKHHLTTTTCLELEGGLGSPFSLSPRVLTARRPATAQDPIDRSMAQAARVKKIAEQSEALKESWEAPTKSFGFWTGANTTAKYSFNLDLAKTGPGRWVGWGRE